MVDPPVQVAFCKESSTVFVIYGFQWVPKLLENFHLPGRFTGNGSLCPKVDSPDGSTLGLSRFA